MTEHSEACVSAVESTLLTSQTTKPKGGYTCCVPGCYSNTTKNKNLSFYMIPWNGPLRTRWLNAIKRKDFVPGKEHRFCSLHGKKIGCTDIPVLFPLIPKPAFRKPPKKHSSVQISKSVKKSTVKPANKSSRESKGNSTTICVKCTKSRI